MNLYNKGKDQDTPKFSINVVDKNLWTIYEYTMF